MKKEDRSGLTPGKDRNPDPGTEGLSFEVAMERLGTIVEKLESGELPLEESLRCFEEGMALSQRASELLGQAERKVEILTRAQDGTARAVPFEDAGGSAEEE